MDARTVVVLILALAFSVASLWLVAKLRAILSPGGSDHLGGRKLLSQDQAYRYGRVLLDQPGPQPFFTWGGVEIPLSKATRHFMTVSASGYGKTITMKLLMNEALQQLADGERALVYDAKGDVLPFLHALGVETATLNPFDARSYGWDMARDVVDEDTAREIAAILIPIDKAEHQRHFPEVARTIVAGVLTAYSKRWGESWEFRDVLCAMRSVDDLRRVLLSCSHTADIVEMHFHDTNEFKSVLTTVSRTMRGFGTIAASWAASRAQGRSISLRDWVSDSHPRVLVLGTHDPKAAALDPVNRVLFKRIASLLLAPGQADPRSPERRRLPRTWVFFDELAKAGNLDGLRELLEQGRQFGVAAALGFQSIEGLADAMQSEDRARAITANCTHQAHFKSVSEQTAAFQAGLVGETERVHVSRTTGTDSANRGEPKEQETRSAKREHLVMPADFLSLPPTDAVHGLTGYYVTDFGVWQARSTPRSWLPETFDGVPSFIPQSDAAMDLQLWTEEERARFCEATGTRDARSVDEGRPAPRLPLQLETTWEE